MKSSFYETVLYRNKFQEETGKNTCLLLYLYRNQFTYCLLLVPNSSSSKVHIPCHWITEFSRPKLNPQNIPKQLCDRHVSLRPCLVWFYLPVKLCEVQEEPNRCHFPIMNILVKILGIQVNEYVSPILNMIGLCYYGFILFRGHNISWFFIDIVKWLFRGYVNSWISISRQRIVLFHVHSVF